MSTLEGVDISNTSSNNPAVNGIIAQTIAKKYNIKNTKCEQAFNNYNNNLAQMNKLLKAFVASRQTLEGFSNTKDGDLTNQEVINSIVKRSSDITGALTDANLGLQDVSNATYQNSIDLLEKKKQAIDASSQAVKDYYMYSGNEFNKNFTEEQELKGKIMTSDRVIQIQEEEYENKVFYSSLFAYFLVYLITVGILYRVKKALGMSFSLFLKFLITFTVILILMVIRRWLQRNSVLINIQHSVARAINDLKTDKLAVYIDELLGPCPNKCSDGSNPTNVPSNSNSKITPSADTTGLQMRTDLTTNAWVDGDQTGTVGIQPAYPGLPDSLIEIPQKNADGTDKTDAAGNIIMKPNPLIEYTCYWNGGQNSGINPSSTELKTTVPCEYLPGYSYVNTGLENNSSKYDNN